METVYLKSQDERTVVSIRGIEPVIPDAWYFDRGYSIIERAEFVRVRRRIQRGSPTKVDAGHESALTPASLDAAPRCAICGHITVIKPCPYCGHPQTPRQ